MKRRSRGEGSLYYSESKKLWVSKITLPDGRRKVKYGKSQKEVREHHQTALNQLRQGILGDETITTADFINRYMESVGRHNLRPKTIESYTALIRLHIIPDIGKIKIAHLRPDHLQALYSQKLEKGLSKRTVQFIHSIIHKCLDQAMRWGIVPRNVADLVTAPTPQRRPPSIFDSRQVGVFLNAVKDHRFYLIYVIAIYCGLREGEVLGIHVEDVDLQKGVINVNHAVQSLAGKGLVVTEPKTDRSRRSISLSKTPLTLLAKHIEGLNRNQGLIFTTSTGHPYSPRNLVRHFKSVLKETGLPNIRFHDLRHTSASLLLAAGVHPKVVQERLGHSTIVLTLDTYSHLIPGMQDRAAEKMEKILSHP